jgi:hypothetical protein
MTSPAPGAAAPTAEAAIPPTDGVAPLTDGVGSLAEAAQLAFLDPAKLHFSRHGATLRLTIDGDRSVLQVSVLRAFPLSEPRGFLSVRDGGGNEVGVLVDPTSLGEEDRKIVEAELERRYLIPIIKRVAAVNERFGTVDWEMETDRGLCKFTTRNLRENVTHPSPRRVVLSDVDGNRYDVPDIGRLDAGSRAALFEHL